MFFVHCEEATSQLKQHPVWRLIFGPLFAVARSHSRAEGWRGVGPGWGLRQGRRYSGNCVARPRHRRFCVGALALWRQPFPFQTPFSAFPPPTPPSSSRPCPNGPPGHTYLALVQVPEGHQHLSGYAFLWMQHGINSWMG